MPRCREAVFFELESFLLRCPLIMRWREAIARRWRGGIARWWTAKATWRSAITFVETQAPPSAPLAEHKDEDLQASHENEEPAELVELAELAYLAELECLAELSSLSNTRPELPSPSEKRTAMGGPPPQRSRLATAA